MIDERDVTRVFRAICLYGLRLHPNKVTEREEEQERQIIRNLLADNDVQTLVEAVRYGMPNVWPFNKDDGDSAFSAQDVSNKILQAKGEAGMKRRGGQIPIRLEGGSW